MGGFAGRFRLLFALRNKKIPFFAAVRSRKPVFLERGYFEGDRVMHTAIGRPLAIAIAISLCFVTASYALPAAEAAAKAGRPLVLVNVAKTKHTSKKSARLHRSERKTTKAKTNVAAKPPIASNVTPNDQSEQAASATLPPDVANAHAELSSGDVKSSESSSTLTGANKTAGIEAADNGVQIAGADQLNDIDRDLAVQAPATAAPVEMAALADNQQSTMTQSFAAEDHSLTGQGWNGAAWIGRIFVGLGAMLTLASAARMLIA